MRPAVLKDENGLKGDRDSQNDVLGGSPSLGSPLFFFSPRILRNPLNAAGTTTLEGCDVAASFVPVRLKQSSTPSSLTRLNNGVVILTSRLRKIRRRRRD